MKVKSLQHAAQTLLQLMVHRQKAYEAMLKKQAINYNHTAFQYLEIAIKKLTIVANGDTQRWNIQDCVKHSPGMYYAAKKKSAEVIPSQKDKLDSCIQYMKEKAYTFKTATA